jgi:hypothetical protein
VNIAFQRLSDLVSCVFELDRRSWKEAVAGARQAEILPKHRTLVFAAKEPAPLQLQLSLSQMQTESADEFAAVRSRSLNFYQGTRIVES